ncbi:MAG TPA: DUF413 domain-containing protein [Pyrinomonadaceae bacterium]|jgi:uncharacterized protein YifE (UPF0438 family)
MNNKIPILSQEEEELIEKHLEFYQSLLTKKRMPTTKAQEHFVAVCSQRAKAETPHELAVAKYLRIKAIEKETGAKKVEAIPEYEEGFPRPDWSKNDDWKKMRAGNYADLKKRQRE